MQPTKTNQAQAALAHQKALNQDMPETVQPKRKACIRLSPQVVFEMLKLPSSLEYQGMYVDVEGYTLTILVGGDSAILPPPHSGRFPHLSPYYRRTRGTDEQGQLVEGYELLRIVDEMGKELPIEGSPEPDEDA